MVELRPALCGQGSLVSFAGLLSAFTNTCCANPCKTDHGTDKMSRRSHPFSVQVGRGDNALSAMVLHLSRPVEDLGNVAASFVPLNLQYSKN